jgi:hypothetical protein
MDRETQKVDFSSIKTFELAFNLVACKYSEEEKFEVLRIIKEREAGSS